MADPLGCAEEPEAVADMPQGEEVGVRSVVVGTGSKGGDGMYSVARRRKNCQGISAKVRWVQFGRVR